MKISSIAAVIVALFASSAIAQEAKDKKDEKPRLFIGDKIKTDVKWDPMNPVASINQTKVIKSGSGVVNLVCMAYIGDLPKMSYKWQLWDPQGNAVDEYTLQPQEGWVYAYAQFMVANPGKYTLAFLNQSDTSKPIATIDLVATADGKAPTDKPTEDKQTKPDKKKEIVLTVCKEVDDNWDPVDPMKKVGDTEKHKWEAGKKFNVLVISEKPLNVDFLGFIIFKQDAEGKDVEFVDEWQQLLSPSTSRKYCTTEGLTTLKAGTYSIYVIDWTKREPLEKNGNYKTFFAKVNLVVE